MEKGGQAEQVVLVLSGRSLGAVGCGVLPDGRRAARPAMRKYLRFAPALAGVLLAGSTVVLRRLLYSHAGKYFEAVDESGRVVARVPLRDEVWGASYRLGR